MKKVLVFFIALVSLGNFLGAQELSEKKDLTIFDISFYKADLDRAVVDSVDTSISEVFINIGRFNVMGMEFRLDSEDINAFVSRVKELKEATFQLPDEVRFGDAYFTLEDFNRMVGSFIIVIPQITNYINEYTGTTYKATVETSFTFIDAVDMQAFAAFKITTEGSHESIPALAAKEAVDDIAMNLTYEIRKIREFQLLTAVLDSEGREITIQMGHDFGLQMGDEFIVNRTTTTRIGRALEEEIGHIIIKQVGEDFSVAHLIYGEAPVGVSAREYPRFGFDLSGQFGVGYRFGFRDGQAGYVSLSMNAIQSRGAFNERLFLNLELPGMTSLLYFIPITMTLGVQYDTYLDRGLISPYWGITLGGAVPFWELGNDDKDISEKILDYLTHLGARVGVRGNLLIGKDYRFGFFGQAGIMGASWLVDNLRTLGLLAGIEPKYLTYFQSYATAEAGLELLYKY